MGIYPTEHFSARAVSCDFQRALCADDDGKHDIFAPGIRRILQGNTCIPDLPENLSSGGREGRQQCRALSGCHPERQCTGLLRRALLASPLLSPQHSVLCRVEHSTSRAKALPLDSTFVQTPEFSFGRSHIPACISLIDKCRHVTSSSGRQIKTGYL